MKILHILIVEDEPWIALDLKAIIIEFVTATVVIEGSVAETKKVLDEALDFAFLDVDVANGHERRESRSLDCAKTDQW